MASVSHSIRTYISGMSSITDFSAVCDAGLPVGVQVQLVSASVAAEIAAYTSAGGQVFCDSGAFQAFMQGGSVDFDLVLGLYDRLAASTSVPSNLAVVAPDVIGNMPATAVLQLAYLPRLVTLTAAGVDVMVPFQQGWQVEQYVAHYRALEAALGDFTLAFACNQAAWKPSDVAQVASVLRPARVHLLGVGIKDLSAYSDAVLWNSPLTVLSSDANRTRVFLGEGRAITTETRKGTAAVYAETAAEFDAFFDDTELTHDLYNSPGYLSPAEARVLADYYGVTDPAEVDRWARWSQMESEGSFADRMEEDTSWSFGCRLGYLVFARDPQNFLVASGGQDLKRIIADHAARMATRDSRRVAMAKVLAADAVQRDRAYRAHRSQGVLFAV